MGTRAVPSVSDSDSITSATAPSNWLNNFRKLESLSDYFSALRSISEIELRQVMANIE